MSALRQTYRRIAAAPLWQVLAGYSLCMTGFFVARFTGDLVTFSAGEAAAALLALVAQSLLITVVALYQDDDIFLAAVILVVLSGAGIMAGLSLAILVVTGSIGPAFVIAAGAPLALFVRALVLVPFAALLIWVLRRFRRFVAPDTLEGSV